MKKLTKRKGFNFFRSYYDVFNMLPKEDKLPFIEALLDKQFLGVDPKHLKGMAEFAWISQINSIESQVKGYEDKMGVKLTPTEGGVITPTEQVEGKEEGKGKEEEKLTEGKPSTKKSLEQRKEQFKIDCFPYMTTYGKDLLTKFFLYWSEHSERGVKMRFEKEKVFNIKLRLATWAKNDKEWNKDKEVDPLVANVMKQVNALKK